MKDNGYMKDKINHGFLFGNGYSWYTHEKEVIKFNYPINEYHSNSVEVSINDFKEVWNKERAEYVSAQSVCAKADNVWAIYYQQLIDNCDKFIANYTPCQLSLFD